MNKLFIAAETVALALATAAASIAEANGPLFRRRFKNPRLRRTIPLSADPAACVDSQLNDEKGWEFDIQQSPLYDLAANNPHVIAASLFSRRHR